VVKKISEVQETQGIEQETQGIELKNQGTVVKKISEVQETQGIEQETQGIEQKKMSEVQKTHGDQLQQLINYNSNRDEELEITIATSIKTKMSQDGWNVTTIDVRKIFQRNNSTSEMFEVDGVLFANHTSYKLPRLVFIEAKQVCTMPKYTKFLDHLHELAHDVLPNLAFHEDLSKEYLKMARKFNLYARGEQNFVVIGAIGANSFDDSVLSTLQNETTNTNITFTRLTSDIYSTTFRIPRLKDD